jgi:hypothetical protein
MKAIRSINLGSAALYGAVLAALWTLAFGIYYWLAGWIFGAQSWFIDMNLGIWTEFTLGTCTLAHDRQRNRRCLRGPARRAGLQRSRRGDGRHQD